MKWINKNEGNYRHRGEAILKDFLKRAWNEEQRRYVNCTYDSLKREGKMKRLLLEQQHNYCCYCMRNLSDGQHTTLEHVIPHRADVQDARWYQDRFPRLRQYVICYHVEAHPNVRLKVPPFPHFCAYDNLVVSCDGNMPDFSRSERETESNATADFPGSLHLCCNNKRGNKRIIPLFFIRNIRKKIVYEFDGELTYDEEKYKNTILALNLEHKTLKLMRRTWAAIVRGRTYSVDDVYKSIADRDLRLEILESSCIPLADEKALMNIVYWRTLYSYRWFFGYFKNKI